MLLLMQTDSEGSLSAINDRGFDSCPQGIKYCTSRQNATVLVRSSSVPEASQGQGGKRCVITLLLAALIMLPGIVDAGIIDGKWLIRRGSSIRGPVKDSSNVIHVRQNITIEEARDWCIASEDCVGVSFAPVSRSSMRTVDYAYFVSEVQESDDLFFMSLPEDADREWVTHILHSQAKVDYPDEEGEQFDKDKHPYRHCCRKSHDLNNADNKNNTSQGVPSPPIKLDEIRQMETVSRIPCNISREHFLAQYEGKRTPVVLEGCHEDWPAKERWADFDTLAHFFENDTTWESCEHYELRWSQVQERMKKRAVCVFHQIKGEQGQQIEMNYRPPPAFKGADLYEYFNQTHSPHFPMKWFSFGSKFTGTQLHHDCHLPSVDQWNTLVRGLKWWILFPPTKILSHTQSVKCDSECSDEGDVYQWFASIGFHAHKFVYEDGMRPLHILQRPGDTVWVPDGWMHSLMNLDECIAVTQSYGSVSNLARIWRQVIIWGGEWDWLELYHSAMTDEQRKVARDAVKSKKVCMPNSGVGCIGDVQACRDSQFFSEFVAPEARR